MTGGGEVVLAVDPGKVSGLFWYLASDPGFSSGIELEQWPFIDMLELLIHKEFRYHTLTVVCESFQVTQRTIKQAQGSDQRLWSVEQIGIIQHMLREREKHHAVFPVDYPYPSSYREQAPSEKVFGTDSKLRRLGWYDKTKGKGHSRDAARHALLHAVKARHVMPHVLLERVD